MSDENTLAEAVGRLSEENRRLKDDLKVANNKLGHEKGKKAALDTIFIIPIYAVCLLVAYLVFKLVSTPAVIDYCFIAGVDGELWKTKAAFRVIGHVPWGNDVNHGYFVTLEEAVKATEQMKCPLQKGK